MIYNKKEFSLGLIMMIGFLVVLAVFFMPVFSGKNGMDYLDNLYNSIAKGSANYIPSLQEDAQEFFGDPISVEFKMGSAEQAAQTAPMLEAAGATVSVDGEKITLEGGMGKIMAAALGDAEKMYANDGDALNAKYGIEGQAALFNWWTAFKAMGKSLTKQEKYKEAAIMDEAMTKGLEPAYNFYGIQAQDIGDRVGTVAFSLAFYVIYTIWYGFAILFMFEGWGLKLSH